VPAPAARALDGCGDRGAPRERLLHRLAGPRRDERHVAERDEPPVGARRRFDRRGEARAHPEGGPIGLQDLAAFARERLAQSRSAGRQHRERIADAREEMTRGVRDERGAHARDRDLGEQLVGTETRRAPAAQQQPADVDAHRGAGDGLSRLSRRRA
jgi:hypothetical protein